VTRRVLIVVALLAAAYVALLATHGATREPDVLVLYTGGPGGDPPRHPETGFWAWVGPDQLAAELDAIRSRRAHRPTFVVDATPDSTRVQRHELDGHRLALVELADGDTLPELDADLVVVATSGPLPALRDGLAVLPGRFDPAATEVDARGAGQLLAPWVDSRWRIGQLGVHWDELELVGRAVELTVGQADEHATTVIGEGQHEHDLIHFGQRGLSQVLAERVRAITRADLVLLNYLSVRAGLVGSVDPSLLEEALPFHNQVVMLTLSSAQAQSVLEANDPLTTGYLVVAGDVPASGDVRVATIDYLANGARGRQPVFLEGRDVLRTGLFTDRIALDLLDVR